MCRAAETALAAKKIPGNIIIYPRSNFIHVDVRNNRYRGENDGNTLKTVTGWKPLEENKPENTTPPPAQPQQKMNNDVIIWNFLTGKGLNDIGTASMMGNLFAESGYRSNLTEQRFLLLPRNKEMTSASYTAAVDNGSYTKEQFIRDGAGYGISQLTYWSRKELLYNYVRDRKLSISDLNAQLEVLWLELSRDFKTVMNGLINAASIRQASDLVLTRFMMPGTKNEQKTQELRAGYSQTEYNKFANKSPSQTFKQYKVKVTASGLHIRQNPNNDKKTPIINTIRNNGTFTILKEAYGAGASKWGFIADALGSGWISLDYVILVD